MKLVCGDIWYFVDQFSDPVFTGDVILVFSFFFLLFYSFFGIFQVKKLDAMSLENVASSTADVHGVTETTRVVRNKTPLARGRAYWNTQMKNWSFRGMNVSLPTEAYKVNSYLERYGIVVDQNFWSNHSSSRKNWSNSL